MTNVCGTSKDKTMSEYWLNSAKHRLFKIMLGVYKDRLRIPRKFAKNFRERLSKCCKLKGPSGNELNDDEIDDDDDDGKKEGFVEDERINVDDDDSKNEGFVIELIDDEIYDDCVDYFYNFDDDDDDEVNGVIEIGESSGTNNNNSNVTNDNIIIEIEEEMTFLCDICADCKPRIECFTIKGCSHSYCSECIRNYVASKLQDGVSHVSCPIPNCQRVLEPEYCREILPFEVFERWGNLVCESVILACQKFYCPFKDCSAMLIDDGGETVTRAECSSCFRLFCAQCKIGWHDGIGCVEFQKLNENERQKEDIMLMNLAKTQNWQRCPVCKYYVERSEGCLYIKCRCGIAFCYKCGAINTDHTHHYCKKCGR